MSRFLDLINDTPESPAPELVFNENASDRDGDGLVQDGTKFERPAPLKLLKKK